MLNIFRLLMAGRNGALLLLLICQCLFWSLSLRQLYHLWKSSLMLHWFCLSWLFHLWELSLLLHLPSLILGPLLTPPLHGAQWILCFCYTLEATYQEVVHWRSNCFKIPYGNVGKRFVLELARLFRAAGEGFSLESIALKAAFTLCSLVHPAIPRIRIIFHV